ncbi:MAG: tetratricopeptide repeat protein [Phycisphaerae bacterium]|nr:tetratricopeptide repeat protein [Phycisphaerae bacterium]
MPATRLRIIRAHARSTILYDRARSCYNEEPQASARAALHLPNRRKITHGQIAAGFLKLLVIIGLSVSPLRAQNSTLSNSTSLRGELTTFLASGEIQQALRRAQQALRASPDNVGVREEYVNLHLTLAEMWLAEQRFDDCTTALEAILAVEPEHASATAMLRAIRSAREHTGEQIAEIERLLQLELYEAALDQIKEVKALRPDLAAALRDQSRAAWLGAADDHYLARNFSEAFALYENLLANEPHAGPRVHSRWAVSLALALSETDFSEPLDPNAAGRLLARAIDVLRKTNEPILGQIIGGMLAERGGHPLDAGRTYAAALGEVWELPPADQRREIIHRLRVRVIEHARGLYRETPVGRREGLWALFLPGTWKHRRTAHFDVYARNDVVAEWVAEAAEYHFAGLCEWLGGEARDHWEPRCEIRVHATRDALMQATGITGIGFAVSRTRLQGERILSRKLEVFQADPWLLSSTLPHELTHLLIADQRRQDSFPLSVDEGLALHAEPPARRLMYRRLLAKEVPAPSALLAAEQLPANVEGFYAEAGALTGWLLECLGRASPEDAEGSPVAALLNEFRGPRAANWWRAFGLQNEHEMNKAWRAWYAARRAPHRMPLMILVEPSPEHRKQQR